jgi:hypothetical protein
VACRKSYVPHLCERSSYKARPAERVAVVLTLQTCIPEVPVSNLGQDIGYPHYVQANDGTVTLRFLSSPSHFISYFSSCNSTLHTQHF